MENSTETPSTQASSFQEREFTNYLTCLISLFLPQCPFGRIIYVFEYKNAPFLRQLQSEITAVNAEALELDTLPQHVIEAALSTYKLSK